MQSRPFVSWAKVAGYHTQDTLPERILYFMPTQSREKWEFRPDHGSEDAHSFSVTIGNTAYIPVQFDHS
jgi:hypothetical protein